MNGLLREGGTPTLTIGPFLDETDGKTPETGLTIDDADVYLSKNGGSFAAKQETTDPSHLQAGHYGCPVNGSDLDSPGLLTLIVNATGALPLRHDFIVLPAVIYDALIGNQLAEPTAIFGWPAGPADVLAYLGALSRNKVLVDGDSLNLRNDADDADIAAYALSDNGTTFTSGEAA
jgi:hypothetical protein